MCDSRRVDVAVIGMGSSAARCCGRWPPPGTGCSATTPTRPPGPPRAPPPPGRRRRPGGRSTATVRDAVAPRRPRRRRGAAAGRAPVLDELRRRRLHRPGHRRHLGQGAGATSSTSACTVATTALAGFVGGHPMAGRETSGFAAVRRRTCSTAAPGCCAWRPAVTQMRRLAARWPRCVTGLGARVVPATAEEHDRAVAAVSHVPHLLAAALATSRADRPARGGARRRLVPGRHPGGREPARADRRDVRRQRGRDPGRAGRGARPTLDDARAALDGPDPIAALAPGSRPATRPGPPGRRSPASRWTSRPRPDALLRLGPGRRLGDRRRPTAARSRRSTRDVPRHAGRGRITRRR